MFLTHLAIAHSSPCRPDSKLALVALDVFRHTKFRGDHAVFVGVLGLAATGVTHLLTEHQVQVEEEYVSLPHFPNELPGIPNLLVAKGKKHDICLLVFIMNYHLNLISSSFLPTNLLKSRKKYLL